MFVARDPPNPFTIRLLFSSGPSKSLGSCDIHAEQRLSIPTSPESVSKWLSLSVDMVAFACIASTDMAMILVVHR
jgi:hypothetical protein